MTAPPGVPVGFAGLGRMGTPMARRVLDAGLPADGVEPLAGAASTALTSDGASAAETPKALAEGVGDRDHDGRRRGRAPGGAAAATRACSPACAPGSILIDTSTIGPYAAVELAAEVTERGAHWIDAPVSGSTVLAEKGELTLMLGGDASAIDARGTGARRRSPRSGSISATPARGRR